MTPAAELILRHGDLMGRLVRPLATAVHALQLTGGARACRPRCVRIRSGRTSSTWRSRSRTRSGRSREH